MRNLIVSVILLVMVSLGIPSWAHAQGNMYGFPPVDDPPIFCGKVENLSCPVEMMPIYQELNNTFGTGDECATGYADFLTNPKTKHYWVEDPDITAQGKADERARQFLYWVLTTNAIDSAPVLTSVWQLTAIISLFGVVLITAIFGIGYIVSQRTNYDFKIRIWPTVVKIGTMLLYVSLSSAIVFILIQFSEIMMKFFFENLGGKELFNIYFANPGNTNLLGATEESYKGFIGCRDLNIRVQEGIEAEIFMLKLTNVSYYVMGVMLLLRKVLLWFLLFVSPFLALLMPFILIRNTGWIWIGVFFQWLFYGPLLTLFLGGMARIWNEGIPFAFDFSRVANIAGYVYPTGINIVYGGPAQRVGGAGAISAQNNASYVDTFAEYVITLIMLWAVTFFPWWLLRIFRDMCCDGIYAMKNILLAMYDNMRGGTGKGPSPSSPGIAPSLKLDTAIPVTTNVSIPLSSLDGIRKTITQDLAKNLNLSASKIVDIAQVQTNKQLNQALTQNITYLANPVQAAKPAERQQFMNIRSELFARAIKNDSVARTILAATSTSASEKTHIRETITRSLPQTLSVSQVVSQELKMSQGNVTNISNTYTKSISTNNKTVQSIAKTINAPAQTVSNILNSFSSVSDQPISKVVSTIAKENNTTIQTVKNVLRQASAIGAQSRIISSIAQTRKIDKSQVSKVVTSIREAVSQPASASASGETEHESVSTIERITTDASRETTRTTQTTRHAIQEVVQTIAHDKETIALVAEKIGSPAPRISSVMESYAQHLDTKTVDIARVVAQETKTDVHTVRDVLAQVAVRVQSDAPVIQTIAQATNTDQRTVQTIARTIEHTAQVSQITETPALQLVTERSASESSQVTSIVQNFSTVSSLVTQVSQATKQEVSAVQNVMRSLSTHLDKSQGDLIQTIASETNISTAQTSNIVQKTAEAVSHSSQYQTMIASATNTDVHTVEGVARAIQEATTERETVRETVSDHMVSQTREEAKNLTKESVVETIAAITTNTEVIREVATQTQVAPAVTQSILTSYTTHIEEKPTQLIQSITSETNAPVTQIQSVISTLGSVVQNSQNVQQSVAEQTQIATTQVQQIATAIPQSVQVTTQTETQATQTASPSIVTQIAEKTNISESESQQIIQNLMSTATQSETFIQHLADSTNLKEQQVKNILTTYTQNITKAPEEIAHMINESSGIPREEVQNVLIVLTDGILQSDEIVSEVAEEEGVDATQVSNVVEQQMAVAAEPEKHIEKTIAIPQNISIEDYEEVKDMWTKHYEEGEVPVSETIESRKDWVDQEIVYITNTLNKILSPDERLQQEGLDELGYLLPIFLINNLKGDELVVYLKAKLEAAKLIGKILAREEKLKEKIKEEQEADEEVFVDVAKKEEEKSDMAIDLDEEEGQAAPQSIEDRMKAVQEKLAAVEDAGDSEAAPDPKTT